MGLRQGARRRGSIIKPFILQRGTSLVKRAFWHFGRDSSEKLAKGQSARCLRDPVGAGRTRQADIPQLIPPPQFNHRNKLVYIKMSKQLHLMKGVLMSKPPFFLETPVAHLSAKPQDSSHYDKWALTMLQALCLVLETRCEQSKDDSQCLGIYSLLGQWDTGKNEFTNKYMIISCDKFNIENTKI